MNSGPLTVPVVLVAGFSQAARHRLIRVALGQSGFGQEALPACVQTPTRPIAWLDHQDNLLPDLEGQLQPNKSFVACVCCSGSLVFTTHLARLLRERPWRALVISLGARAEPRAMLRLLSETPWREHLGPIRLFSIMDALGLALCMQKEHPLYELACQQRDLAEQVLGVGEFLPGDLF